MILTATHISSGESLRFPLERGHLKLGRTTEGDPTDKLSVPFDPRLSRRLAVLEVKPDSLLVERDQSRYPLFHEGQEKEQFELLPGQRFSSGETVFELHQEGAQTLKVQQVDQSNPGRILQVLLGFQALLPRWHEPESLARESVKLLKELMPEAQVAFFSLDSELEALTPTDLVPSRSLLSECLKERLPAYHVWSPSAADQPTQQGGESWALAAPVLSSADRLVLYAVGRESENAPGELERSALALVAQILGQHLEGRQALLLQARVQAEARANQKLRTLLETIEQSLSLQQEDGFQRIFLEGARRLTECESAHFELDLSSRLALGRRSGDGDGCYLCAAFERSEPEGILCLNPPDQPFTAEQEDWLVALVGFVETVLENRRLHRQVQSSLAKLKDNQAQMVRNSQWAAAGRLAANASHELNTPLGAIRLSAESALAFMGDGPKLARDSLQLILRSVERCRKVTERFLVYSRPEEEREAREMHPAPVVEDSVGTVAPFARTKGITLDWEVDPELVIVGDPQDLYWAVTNLLKNAVDAIPEDSPEKLVRVRASTEENLVRLHLEDSGPGIPEAIRAKIFEPFFSTKKLGQGNGLGLAISRRNLQSWGGELELQESSLGGAGFCLTLPRSV